MPKECSRVAQVFLRIFFEVASLAFGEHNDPGVSPGTSHQFVLEQLLQANLIQKFTIAILQSKEATGRRLERCAG